jgi:general stress protein YciG
MTSQSPRIYLYKITFEEVSYYYYGVHKEKTYNEYYMGSPVTHKWVWDFYTPKKQILQLFDFTDEGWLEANLVEDRLIKPFYNTDKWCLNESCGGIISLNLRRKYGKANVENKTGFCGRSKEKMSEDGRKGGEIMGQVHKENRTGVCGLQIEERRKIGKKGGTKTYKEGTGCFSLTPEERSEVTRKVNNQRWMCIETGYITAAGPLSNYQRARGIDTSKRKRIS